MALIAEGRAASSAFASQEELMEVTENAELFIIVPVMLLSIVLLMIIDRIGTVRVRPDEEEDV